MLSIVTKTATSSITSNSGSYQGALRFINSSFSSLAKNVINTTIKKAPLNRNFFKVISQGYEGQRLFLGRNPEKLSPGLWLYLPPFQTITTVDMRESSVPIPSLNAFTKDNVPVTLSGSLFYKISDSHKACFGVQDYYSAISNLGTSAARSVIGRFEYDEINGDRNQINTMLKSIIDQQCDPWGLACTKFEIQEFKPQNEHVMRQLELQMEAERKRRENDLNTKAAIRTAEGLKDAEILKSEGALASSKNAAEAQYITTIKEADGIKYKILAEAQAKKFEIEMVSSAFGGNSAVAYDYLMEMNRIEQLKAIAYGRNNSTYFIPTEFSKLLEQATKSISSSVGEKLKGINLTETTKLS